MPSTVLLVDSGNGIREVVERHIDSGMWSIVQRDDVDVAWNEASVKAPDLVVLNADVAKGWNLCAQLKRKFASVPVVLLSYKANKELFNNHQKLPTRADAYHHLPDELDGLSISLSYYSSRKAEEPVNDDSPKPRPRGQTSRVAVPTGIVQRLEGTVGEQAREIENLKRQIEALEAERDAVTEKARRQMIELMALSPGPDLSGEVQQHKRRIGELEAELDTVRAASRDAADRAQLAEDAKKSAESMANAAQAEVVALRASGRAGGTTQEQIAVLTAQLAQAHERRIAAESVKTSADERAATAERAWSAVNVRAEELQTTLAQRVMDLDRVQKEKSEVETALGMSRKLMKDYISEAARNAETARTATEKVREIEVRLQQQELARGDHSGELQFQKALIDSMDETAKSSQGRIKELEVLVDSESKRAAEAEGKLTQAEGKLAQAEARAAAFEAQTNELETRIQTHAARAFELEARGAELESLVASTTQQLRDSESSMKAVDPAVVAREQALRAWGKRLQNRLDESQVTHDAIVARLASLVDDLKALPKPDDEPPPA